MITLIVGQNAIGKSIYLKNKAKRESLNSEVLCNFIDGSYLRNVKYNKDRLEELKDLLDTDIIIENKDRLGIETDVMSIGNDFENILTIICKDYDKLYMDEPEFGLSYREIGRLIAFLTRIEDTFKEIVMVTHSEMFLGIPNKIVKTVKYDTVLNEFIAVEIKETAYESID